MLDNFRNWIIELKEKLKEKGVETEEINLVDAANSDNPSVTVHHYSPKKFIGLITLWESNAAYFEVLDYANGDTVISRHLKVETHSEFYEVFNDYLAAMAKEV